MESNHQRKEDMEDNQTTIPESHALDEVRKYLASTIYAPDEALDAIALVLAVSHTPDSFNTVPFVLVRSKYAASGKTTVLDAALACGGNAWDGSNATEPGIKSKLLSLRDEDKRLTLVVDEISKIFGESGLNGRTNPLYRLMVPRYRKTAMFSFSNNKVAEEVPSYGVTFMAGLQTAAPNDIKTRSIEIDMMPKPAKVHLDDSQDADVIKFGEMLGDVLHQWAKARADVFHVIARDRLRTIHPKLHSRRKQIWGPLFAVAAAAGGSWPARCMEAFQMLALEASEKPVLTPSQQTLLDSADILRASGEDRILAPALRALLQDLPDRSMYDIGDGMFMKVMVDALGPATPMRHDAERGRGYMATEIIARADDLKRALTPVCEDPEDDEITSFFAVEEDFEDDEALENDSVNSVNSDQASVNSASAVAEKPVKTLEIDPQRIAHITELLNRPNSGARKTSREGLE
jgi:hypothetical protein